MTSGSKASATVIALLASGLVGCPTTGGPQEADPIDDREPDFYEYECPDCAPAGDPIPGEVP